MKTPRRSAPVHSGPADHVVGDAAAQSPGTGTRSASGGDWLGEITEPAAPPPGEPVATRAKVDRRRGQAIESRRQRR
jgi:hypothetical protein